MSLPTNVLRWAGIWAPPPQIHYLYDVVLDTSVGNQYVYIGQSGTNTLTAPNLNPAVWVPYPVFLPSSFVPAYGSFVSNTQQIVVPNNTNIPITHDLTLLSAGVVAVGPAPFSLIQVAEAGIYKISYSVQLDQTMGGNNPINIFPVVNGTPVTDSNSQMIVSGQNDESLLICEYLLQLPAGAQVGWVMNGLGTVVLQTFPAVGGANPIPQTPSVITTIYRVG